MGWLAGRLASSGPQARELLLLLAPPLLPDQPLVAPPLPVAASFGHLRRRRRHHLRRARRVACGHLGSDARAAGLPCATTRPALFGARLLARLVLALLLLLLLVLALLLLLALLEQQPIQPLRAAAPRKQRAFVHGACRVGTSAAEGGWSALVQTRRRHGRWDDRAPSVAPTGTVLHVGLVAAELGLGPADHADYAAAFDAHQFAAGRQLR